MPENETTYGLLAPSVNPQRNIEVLLDMNRITGLSSRVGETKAPRLQLPVARLSGTLPRIAVEAPCVEETPEAAEIEAIAVTEERSEPQPTLPLAAEISQVVIQKLPPATKKERRQPKADTAPKDAAVPKPLKVIRRRREQEPKIFETPPKILPDSILRNYRASEEEDLS